MASFKALSREGHAAMSIRGESDRWVVIQKNTFTNWVNEQLRVGGIEHTEFVQDLETAFDDGVKLCRLVESLQGKKIGRVIKKPLNHHQNLENVTLSLSAIANDNVRLVNIGPEDIVNGNLKLILGLIWHLILRYQIGKTKFPTKKLMLAWLHAVIPECHVTNFTSDWNSGIALHALIDFCRPGLSPNWRNLSRSDGLSNCQTAMQLAKQNFDIPLVVRPEDLSSSDLDELSAMTYLSYFMKVDSPGYHATMAMLRKLLKHGSVNNFTSDWQDGRLLCNLCVSLGQSVAGWPTLTGTGVENQQLGIEGAQKLGVNPILTAKEMCDPEVDHIGIMAYVAYFGSFKPTRAPAEKVVIDVPPRDCYIGIESTFSVRIDDPDISPGDVRGEVKGPDSNYALDFSWSGRSAKVSFTPRETGHHRLNVFCENQLIVGCPVSFKVLADRSKITFTQIDRCTLGMITEFRVNSRSAGQGDIQVEARAPGGRVHNLAAVYRNGEYVMNFTPSEVGVWQIMVKFDGDHISGSPFRVHVFDPSAVQVYGLEGGTVGMGLAFNADTSRAGDGDLKVTVMHEGRQVPAYITTQRSGLYRIDYTPEGAGTYKVFVYYNEIEVKGSPYTMDIVDSSRVTVSGEGLSLVPVNRTARFVVDTNGGSSGSVKVEITAPNGKTIPYNIGSDGSIEYTPMEVGDHRIEVKYGDNEVEGSPFTAKAYDTSAIVVSPLYDGLVGNAVDFTIDVTRAGEGQLEIMVNNGNLPNTVDMEKTGVYKISFTPENAERQYVDINFNSEGLPGSPFSCMSVDAKGITVDGLQTVLPTDKLTAFTIQTSGGDVSPVVDVYTPSGDRIPARIISQYDGTFKVEWTPSVAGRHNVEVSYSGRQIDGSPFVVDVFDLALLRIENFRQSGVGETASFDFDLSQAGLHNFDVVVRSPTGQIVDHRISGNMVKDISYIPSEAGPHEIYVNYYGFELPGCPYIQNIDEGGMPTASGDGLYRGEEDKVATFTLDVGRRNGDLEVKVNGPYSIAKTTLQKSGDQYIVSYVPVEVGIFDIQIRWNGKEIPGSPYHPKILNCRKVQISGGWSQYMDANQRVGLVVNDEKRLLFDISQAGPGSLKAKVEGPNASVPVSLEDNNGQVTVAFVPVEEGNHYIHLYWSDLTLPSSPFLGYAVPAFTDSNKVILTGRGLKESTVREESEFVIDGSQAGPGYTGGSAPEVTLTGVRAEINVKVLSIGNGKYRCTYIPVVPGAYLLHITWNGRQLRGSPYKVNVIGAFYPNKVNVSGEGLKGGILGRNMEVAIDTRKAGPGELTAFCMGPNKAAYCELEDNHDGTFYLRIRALESGRHVLQIKYGGEHVNGSPFVLKVSAQPDASKVRVTGPGVEHGILATFKSRFIVETRGAGAGQLTVRIRGPKGGFQVEMYRDSQRDRTILCRYDPTETGLYIVSIKWSGMDVPGSPFQVQIVDTQQELEQVLQDASFSASSITPRQWREDI